jgi:hypothetical protein
MLPRELTRMKNEIIGALKNVKCPGSEDLVKKLSAAQRMATQDMPREAILKCLRYPEMDYRQGNITTLSNSSYSWMFELPVMGQPPIRYVPWLREDDGIFWVTGKAGSGKSTLMKHIYKDERTHAALRSWANGRQIFTASHYFWYAGSPIQKSHSGLMRSILYEILDKCPDLIESVCKDRWRDELRGRDALPWGVEELKKCLDALVSRSLELGGKQICFCFFIDGLDEYDGDLGDDENVIDALETLSQNGHTKICASSRPRNKFEMQVSASKAKNNYLELHQHTRGDISDYVKKELESRFADLSTVYKEWESLSREVVDRSEGVFLWVTLVVKRELRPMLEDREDMETIRKRLDEVPGGMDFGPA